jgi:hypothetical protein
MRQPLLARHGSCRHLVLRALRFKKNALGQGMTL